MTLSTMTDTHHRMESRPSVVPDSNERKPDPAVSGVMKGEKMSIVKVAGTEYRVIVGYKDVLEKDKHGIPRWVARRFETYRRAVPKPDSKRDMHRKIVAIKKLPKKLQAMFFNAMEKQA